MNENMNNYEEPSTSSELANMGRKTVGVAQNVGNLALGMGRGLSDGFKKGKDGKKDDGKKENDKKDDGNKDEKEEGGLPKKDGLDDSSDEIKDIGKKGLEAGGKVAKKGAKLVGKGLKALWKLIPFPWNLIILGFILIIILILFIIVILGGGNEANGGNCSYDEEISYEYSCTKINVEGYGYVDLEDYVAGVVGAEVGGFINSELYKTFAVSARTYALDRTEDCTSSTPIPADARAQEYDPSTITDTIVEAVQATEGEVLIYNGEIFATMYDNFKTKRSGCIGKSTCTATYIKLPNNETHEVTISSANYRWLSDEFYGHGHGVSQIAAYEMANNGSTYEEIIEYFYSDGVQIANHISENCDAEDTEKIDGGFRSQLYFYDQTEYADVPYCGRKIISNSLGYCSGNQNSICSSGCGGTSVAMAIASFLDDSSITPVTISEELGKYFSSACSISGTSFSGLANIAQRHGLNTLITTSQNGIYNALSTGNALVIVNMFQGCFTGGGHYILLTGYENGQVHVLDPNGGDWQYTRIAGCSVSQRIRNGWWNVSDVFNQQHNQYYLIISDMDINQLIKD